MEAPEEKDVQIMIDWSRTEKKCHKCGVVKELDLFYKDSSTPDAKTARCKKCMNAAAYAYAKERRRTDPEFRRRAQSYTAAYNKRRYHTDPVFRQKVLDYHKHRNATKTAARRALRAVRQDPAITAALTRALQDARIGV